MPGHQNSVMRMNSEKVARFFLPWSVRQRAVSGEHNFINKLAVVLGNGGFEVRYEDPDDADPRLGGYSIFYMKNPFARNSISVRRAYYYPFWHIECTNERWHWDVAETPFDAQSIDPKVARQFFRGWRERLYEAALRNKGNDGFVYVPLQGRLLDHRSFQHSSPMQMLGHTLAHNPGKQVVATLHPGEIYTDAELATLDAFAIQHPRLKVQMGGMEELLPRCDYVVSMNSSVAFAGFFFRKPCVLFADIDFHHIAANVGTLGVSEAFEQVREMRPDYAAYVWWFLQHMSINAGRPEANEKIRTRLMELGWPL